MLVIRLESVLQNPGLQKAVLEAIRNGKILVYPTDTVYGVGCDATNPDALRLLRKIKNKKGPLSAIAPSAAWIQKNTKIKTGHKEHLKKLPGRYTLLLLKKTATFLKDAAPGKSIGVRIPDHPLTKIIQKSGVPFITTSANVSGQPTMTQVSEFPEPFKKGVSLVIDGGVLAGEPSTVIDLTGKGAKQVR